VVCVGVLATIAAECEDDLRAIGSDSFDEQGGGLRESGEFELSVLVVEHFVVGDVEDLARSGKLCSAHAAQLCGSGGGATISGGLTVGKAEDGGFDAAFGGQHECSAKAEALVIGMGGNAEKFEGGFFCHGYIKGNACWTAC